MKDLNNMKKEDIFNSELIGAGLPDLQDEIDKIQNESATEQSDGGLFGQDQGGEDICGFGSQKKQKEEEED